MPTSPRASVSTASAASAAAATLNAVQQAVLHWSAQTRRNLPWRRTRDPWAVLVSELMLQQTQVARVVPKYVDFLDRFPDAVTCAAAPLADVVRAWAGLGYNRRAVNLHRCAVIVADTYDGQLPADLDALLALPGIGPYTARAVLAFAFEQDVGVLDTNAARVLARLEGRPLGWTEAQARADELVPLGQGWTWNQAVLDLGALVCTKRQPRCDGCPLESACAWSHSGQMQPDPATGSAGVSTPQSRFEGSDRQGRGRLVAALRRGAVAPGELASVMGWPDDADRAARVAATLVDDGLAVRGPDGGLTLP